MKPDPDERIIMVFWTLIIATLSSCLAVASNNFPLFVVSVPIAAILFLFLLALYER